MATLLGKQVKAASASGSGEFIRSGDYVFMIERVFEQKGYEGECMIAELRVVKAEPINAGDKPNPVGSSCSVVYNVTKNKEAALGNIKKFMMALHAITEDEFSDEIYGATVDQKENPARGALISCRTRQVENKGRHNPANRGMIMTVPVFSNVPDQSDEEVLERRQGLDNAAKAKIEDAKAKPADVAAPAAPKTGGRLGGLLAPKA